MSSEEGKNGNNLATASFGLGIVGLVTSIFFIGIPFCVIAVMLGVKALKIGKFGYYESYDTDTGISSTMSYSFRAYMGLIFGGIGCLIGFVMICMAITGV